MEKKRIFTEKAVESLAEQPKIFAEKREFKEDVEVIVEQALEIEPDNNEQIQLAEVLQPRSTWWKKGLVAISTLFAFAVIAQAIQWLVTAWQQNQWINFAFAIVFAGIVSIGIIAVLKEWRYLRKLKKLTQFKQEGQYLLNETLPTSSAESAVQLCEKIIANTKLSVNAQAIQQWKTQVSPAYSGQEVAFLFSQTVLNSLDQQAKRLITKSASESAILVAISPLALVDMAFVAWRSLRLINKLAALYGVELGYFSRIKLLKLIIVNIAFAGATEVLHDIGMDWLSQDLTAKLSTRVAQGVGVGILTARLGIKALEFCRPLPFVAQEKMSINSIQKELLRSIKQTLFKNSKQ